MITSFVRWSCFAAYAGLLAPDYALHAADQRLDDMPRTQARGHRPVLYRAVRRFCGEVKAGHLAHSVDSVRHVQAEGAAWSCAIVYFRYGACTACANARAIRRTFKATQSG